MNNDLPDLNRLFAKWEQSQSKDPKPDGYVAIIREDRLGPVLFCVDSLDEWKALWPAFLFSGALLDINYEIYNDYGEGVLEKLKKQYQYFSKVEWNKQDFEKFGSLEFETLEGMGIEFCGSVADWIVKVVNEMRKNVS